MELKFDIKDSMVSDLIIKEIQSGVKARVNMYMSSPTVTTMIENICKTELNRLATQEVMSDKIKAMMSKQTEEILPEALNDKFIGAYMAVVISEARKHAAEATTKFHSEIAKP